jgi:hypothetical protein
MAGVFSIDFLLKLFILKLTISHVIYTHECDCIIFSCILLLKFNNMVNWCDMVKLIQFVSGVEKTFSVNNQVNRHSHAVTV